MTYIFVENKMSQFQQVHLDWNIYGWMTNSVDPDQADPYSSLIWFYISTLFA